MVPTFAAYSYHSFCVQAVIAFGSVDGYTVVTREFSSFMHKKLHVAQPGPCEKLDAHRRAGRGAGPFVPVFESAPYLPCYVICPVSIPTWYTSMVKERGDNVEDSVSFTEYVEGKCAHSIAHWITTALPRRSSNDHAVCMPHLSMLVHGAAEAC